MAPRGRTTTPKAKTIPKKNLNPHLPQLRKRVSQSPTGPGIYRWLDEKGTVLYVGKAKNLRKRLSNYVQGKRGTNEGPWKQSFLAQIADVDMTVTNSELEALLLETNLIKQLRPKYNVLMKDDKSYLFVRVTMQEPYPRVESVRRFLQDGAKYFGPYMSSTHVRETLDLLHEALQYRACKASLDILNKHTPKGGRLSACLEHQIGRCNGLCTGALSREEYLSRIERVISFFKGNEEPVRQALRDRMQAAAKEKKFEQAAKFRNYLNVLEGKPAEQLATDGSGEDSDVIGVAVLSGRAHVVVLHRRNGRLINESHFALQGQAESAASVLEQFIPQFYDEGQEVPPAVMLPTDIPDQSVMAELLRERRKGAVKLLTPERGRKSHLVQLAEKNALEKARQMEMKWEAEERNAKNALEQLQEILGLPTLPKRIEGYDISHLGGTETVGSMVVIKDGKAASDQYRSFTIRSLERGEVDDYRSIKEVLTRRLRRLTENLKAEEKEWKAKGLTFGVSRKSEQEAIKTIIDAHPADLCDYNWQKGKFLVARKDGRIVGMVQLAAHDGKKNLELDSVWVDKEFRGGKLGHFLVRSVLRKVKKGKVYLAAFPAMEEYYGQTGFRIIREPPAWLSKSMEPRREKQPLFHTDIYMMWEAHQNKIDPSLSATPDLLVIDGGKGQLSTVVSVLKDFKLDIPVIGLAKRVEEVFKPGDSFETVFPKDSQAKFLLMRLRDEAHRFSNAHREKRAKTAMKASALDEMPGIGEETKKKLLKKFGSMAAMKEATDDELKTVLSSAQLEIFRKG